MDDYLYFACYIMYVDAEYPDEVKLGQAFIKSILGDYEDIDDIDGMELDTPPTNGMKVLKNVVELENGGTGNVIVRNNTENFWLKVIEATETETDHVCALGTPGIGKTTTTCILIRLLLKKNRTVVYRVREKNNDGIIYMFTRSRVESEVVGNVDLNIPITEASDVDVKVIEEKYFKKRDVNVDKEDIYYVVDPGETTDSCNLSGYQGKVIIVASPDEGHWGGSNFDKGRGFPSPSGNGFRDRPGIFLYYPVWTLSELLASFSYITKSHTLDESTLKNRFLVFGGVPRYVFSENVESYAKKQKTALEGLRPDSAFDLAKNDRTAIQTSLDSIPKGILLSYILSENDNGSFKNAHAILSSDFVYERFTNSFMQHLWEKIVPNFGKFDPYLFETFCTMSFWDSEKQKKIKFTIRKAISAFSSIKSVHIELNQCIRRVKVHNVVESAREEEKVLFLPISRIYKLIDFGYRDGNTYHCFQCTIAPTHSANIQHIYELVLNVIDKSEDEVLQPMNVNQLPRIKIYYAVPEFRFKGFCIDPKTAISAARKICKNQRRNNLYKNWNKLVTIDIMSIDPPNSTEPTMKAK